MVVRENDGDDDDDDDDDNEEEEEEEGGGYVGRNGETEFGDSKLLSSSAILPSETGDVGLSFLFRSIFMETKSLSVVSR
jgi:hypothetical protein